MHTLLHSSTCTHLKENVLDESGASAAVDSCVQEILKMISAQVKKEPESSFSNATTITTPKATSKKKKNYLAELLRKISKRGEDVKVFRSLLTETI